MKNSRYESVAVLLLLGALPIQADDNGIATKYCLANPPHALRHHAQLQCPPPIDESIGSRPVDWSPWTHHPNCVNAEKEPSLKYCVYSNSRHGYHGISIITKPKTAADSANMLNEVFSGGHRINATAQSYAIVDIPLKGKGVVATRKISRAETFMSDWATVLLDLSFPGAMQQRVGHRFLHLAAEQLSDPNKVLGLGRSSARAIDIMEDILGTNAFSYTLGDDPHMALYPEVSVSSYWARGTRWLAYSQGSQRINHACKPNAFVRFSPTSFDVRVVAFRDIEMGEEITISYIPMNYPREKRQRNLGRWGFESSLQEEIIRAIGELDGTTAVRAAYEILALVEAEDIPTMMASQYEILARLFWKAGDTETAIKYAQQSLDTLMDLGYIDYHADDLQLLLKDFAV